MTDKITINPHNPKDVAEVISTYVNNFSFKADALAEEMAKDHRTLLQSKMQVVVKFIELMAWAESKQYFDLRNEATVKCARKMIDATTEAERCFPCI
jgi:hypothetical protein